MARWWHAMQTDVNVNGFISVVLALRMRQEAMVSPLFPRSSLLSPANDDIAKWYCEDCKKRLRMGGKAIGAR